MRFVRLVTIEGWLARAMRLSTYESISPLTPEPAGFPPSPAKGRGRHAVTANWSVLPRTLR